MKLLKLQEWGIGITKERPLIISGPCSAETEKQVLDTANNLKKIGINIFRAGLWKPRTRPNNFEGVGEKGLDWLEKVKKETGMLVATEVANANHLDKVLKSKIDIIWIGARTTANPFAVQEIATALEGVNIPVFIKNPINPDIELWIGAIERIYKSGINKIGVIHRGFSTYKKTKYRNNPQWQIAIDLMKKFPKIPILCDPSHISGNVNLIQSISQKAMDLNYNGLIIESHINPNEAISDKYQQVKPNTLLEIINSLSIRDNSFIKDKILESMREEIDDLDQEIFRILEERMKVVENIGIYKKENGITILQPERWKNILDKVKESGQNLNEKFSVKILKLIHQESINRQTKIMNDF